MNRRLVLHNHNHCTSSWLYFMASDFCQTVDDSGAPYHWTGRYYAPFFRMGVSLHRFGDTLRDTL